MTETSEKASSSEQRHATCVALNGKGILLIGTSGSGKSATALALIAHGAELVSDDQVTLNCEKDQIFASGIEGFEGMIEARGVGILRAKTVERAPVNLVVDMDTTELHRLPPDRHETILGIDIPKINGRENPFLVPSLLTLLAGERLK